MDAINISAQIQCWCDCEADT
uniref:Uncharacterized protein n=1 Tax=Arundo donax TaxID=35708 RepID=A0A0A8ZB98_ARUDO